MVHFIRIPLDIAKSTPDTPKKVFTCLRTLSRDELMEAQILCLQILCRAEGSFDSTQIHKIEKRTHLLNTDLVSSSAR